MASNERVTLTAELRDEVTAPLNKMNAQIDSATRKIDQANKATQKSTEGTRSAFSRFASGGTEAFSRFAGGVRSGLDRGREALSNFTKSGQGAFSRFGASVRDGLGRGREALSGFAKRIHDSDGMFGKFVRGGTRGLQNLAAGFRDPRAAASSFTGVLGTIGGAARKLPGALGGIGKALGPAVSAAGNVVSSVGRIAGSAISTGASIVSGIVTPLANGLAKAGKIAGVLGGLVIAEGLRGGLSRAMNIEDAEARMRGMGYAAGDISELMDNASDAIMGTAYRLDDAATAAAQFSASGIEAGEDMERVIGLVGDSAFAAGTDFSQMSEIWAQVAARGRLDGQTMNRLLSAGVGITGELADKFGVAEEEVQKLVSEGSVSFEDFAEVMETKVGGAAQEMATTTRGALMNVQAGLHMVGAEVAGPFMELFRGAMNRLQEPMFALAAVVEPVFGVLTERAKEWASGMYESGEEAAEGINRFVKPMQEVAALMEDGEGLFSALGEVFDIDTESGLLGFLSQAIDLFQDLSPLTNIFTGIAESASGAFDAIFDALKTVAPVIGASFQRIGEAIGPLIVVLAEGFGEIVTAIGPSLIRIINMLVAAFSLILPVITDIITIVVDAVAMILPLIMPVLEQVVSAIAYVLIELSPVIATIVSLIADAIVQLVPIITPIITLIADMLVSLVPIVMRLVDALIPVIDTVIELGVSLLMMLLPVLEPIGELIMVLVDAAAELLIALMPLIPALLEIAFRLIEPMIDLIITLAPLLAVLLVGAINILVPILVWLIEKVVSIVEWFNNLGEESELMGATITDVWNWISEAVGIVVEWFMEEALPWMLSVWEGIGNGLTWLWEEVISPVVDWIKEKWQWLVESLTEFYEEWIQPFFELFGAVMSWLWEEKVSPILEWISEKWSWLSTTLSEFWTETIRPMFERFGEVVSNLWNDYISPIFEWIGDAWDTLSGTISRIWNENLKPVFQAVGDFVMEDVVGMIASGVDAIESTWNTVANLFRKPINWVIDTVWNKGIKRAFDGVADVVGYDGKRIPEIGQIGEFGGGSSNGRRGSIPGYAEGGLADRGWAIVGEEGPELVRFHQPGKVYTADETRDALTGAADETRGALTGAAGGIGSPLVRFSKWFATRDNAVAEAGREKSLEAVQWVRGKFADTAQGIIDPLVDKVTGWLSGTGMMGDLASGLMTWGVDQVMSWIRGKDQEAMADGYYDGEFTANPGGFNRPAQGPVTSRAGRRSYLGAFGGMHYGVDIGNSIGTAIRAAWSGVVKSTSGSGLDQRIVLNHGGFDTAYFHNSALLASPGDTVTGGQQIARMGSAGTGPHLHFEYHPGGWYNPSIAMANKLVRDNGGPVPPGLSLIQNGTGVDEFMLNDTRFGQVEDALDYVSALLPAPGTAAHSSGATMIDSRVTVESGAVQISVEAGPDGFMSPEGLDALKDAIEEIFQESARRDY